MAGHQDCELIVDITNDNMSTSDTNYIDLGEWRSKALPSEEEEEKNKKEEEATDIILIDKKYLYNFKSINRFKKEWKKGKQIGWGGQGSIFEVIQNMQTSSSSSYVASIEYVAKIIYFTNDDIYKSIQDRINGIKSVMDEYILVKTGNLLNYVNLYYDECNYMKCIIIMEKLSHSLSSKRDWKYKPNKYQIIREIAKNLALNIKEIHDLEYVHLDINKENIMWNETKMEWRIIDYGLAKYIDPNKGYIKYDGFIGTKTWTAPEIVLLETISCGDGDMNGDIVGSILSKKCDIYSYGLVILNIASGGHHYGELLKGTDINTDSENGGNKQLSEIEMLRKLNTEEGHYMLHCHLMQLKKNQIIDTNLYIFLSRILTYDPQQRPSIDQILDMYYLRN